MTQPALPIVAGLLAAALSASCRRAPPVVVTVEVETDDALAATVADAVHTARVLAEENKLSVGVSVVGPTAFEVHGLKEGEPPVWLAAGLGPEWRVVVDRTRVRAALGPEHTDRLRQQAVSETMRVLERRVRAVGILASATVTVEAPAR